MATGYWPQTVFGTGVESTYGTPVTVDRWYGLLPSGGLNYRPNYVVSQAMFPTSSRNAQLDTQRIETWHDGGGPTSHEVGTTGFGRLFEHVLGGTGTVSQPDATTNPTVYSHVYDLGSTVGKSLTLQKVLREADGTNLQQFTYHGSKVASAEFSIARGGILQLNVTWDCEDVDTTTSIESHTVTPPTLFHFQHADLKKGGSSVTRITDATIAVDQVLRGGGDSIFMGNSGLKGEPAHDGDPVVTGTLTGEFQDTATWYDVLTGNTSAALNLKFTAGTIAGGDGSYNYDLDLSLPAVRLQSDTINIGSGPVMEDVAFQAFRNAAGDEALTATYVTTDSAV